MEKYFGLYWMAEGSYKSCFVFREKSLDETMDMVEACCLKETGMLNA